MLTHYTNEPDALVNILNHGFAWVANRRHLAAQLVPMHAYSTREPQQFGMVSFTELRPEEAGAHTAVFGRLGIVVADSWARRHNAQRVMYVENKGPFTDALCAVFKMGYDDLKASIEYPDDGGWLMSFENKTAAAAVAGASLWANLLTIWEYLEPASSAYQREWRIVNPLPLYSLSEDKKETIENVTPPKGWAQHTSVISVTPADVEAIVCPSSLVRDIRSRLPSGYQDVQIIETDG